MADPVSLAAFVAQFTALDAKDLSALIQSRHPDYEEKKPHWEFLESCYDGGREWFKANIFRYLKEGDREYKDRVARAYRFNHTREVVDLVNKYIFKAGVNRREEDASPEIKAFWKNTTLRRRAINEFMKLLAQKTSVFGKCWVIVDSSLPASVKTIAEAKRIGARTYAYILPPQDVLDASFASTGELNWLFVKEHVRDDGNFIAGSRNVECRYRLWTKQYWIVFAEDGTTSDGKKKYKVVGFGEHGLGRVPAFPADHIIDQDTMTATSLIDDVAYLDRSAANYLSNLDAIIQDQTFSQLIIPAQGMLPGENEEEKMTEMGTKRIMTFDAQASIAPAYISPDPRQAGIILQVIEKIISEIYHTVGMAGERTKQDNSMGIDNSSGVAKAYDFDRMNAMLASKANALQFAENELIALVCAWHGAKPPEKDLVCYPQNFDVRSLYDEFEIATKLALVAAPKSVRREQMKITAEKLFPRLKESDLEAMKKEIDTDWPEDVILPMTAGGSKLPTPKPAKENSQGQNNKPA